MRLSTKITLAVALAALAPGAASAQWGGIGSYSPPRTGQRPTISPYLNLTRGGDAAINYYGLVRPQIDMNRQLQQLEQGTFMDPRLGALQQGYGPDGNPMFGAQNYLPNQAAGLGTGHPAGYFYYSHYYQFPNRQGGGTGASSSFGRPSQSQSMPFYSGTGGIIMPVNPSGPNPLGGIGGGGLFNGGQFQNMSGPQPTIMP